MLLPEAVLDVFALNTNSVFMEQWQRQFIRYLFPYSAKRLRIEPAYVVKHPHIPKYLYKYRCFSSQHLDALHNGILWMSSPDNFNDPFDTTVYFDPDRFLVEDLSLPDLLTKVKRLQEAKAKGEAIDLGPLLHPIRSRDWRQKLAVELLASETADRREKLLSFAEEIMEAHARELRRQSTNFFRAGFSVLSLAGNPTAILMWSHYSGSHRGFCIEYDFANMPPGDLRRRLCYPVLYRAKRTDATRYMERTATGDFNNLFGQYLCLLKKNEWAYEQEWRIIHPTGAPNANKQIIMPVPSAIILGSQVTPDSEDAMRNFCVRNKIRLKRGVQIDGELELKIEDA